ncbi:conserved exported protein of unknown function [Rhodovastum atsumiense]|nr:DUF459 domain-containing protein [Rhodovastum atsumiense]CAH2603875.1 conserved exported protein of unknown function [Rhodovastum atsumiense]
MSPKQRPSAEQRLLRNDIPLLSRRSLTVLLATALAAPALPARAAPLPPLAVFGDSQAEGVAVALRQARRRYPDLRVQNCARAGSAISQAAAYDWPAAIRTYTATAQGGVAIMFFGGNDRLPIRLAGERPVQFRSDAWRGLYMARVTAMLETLRGAGIGVLWLGQPVARDGVYSHDMAYLNGIYQDMVQAAGGTFVPLWSVVADAAGHYVSHGRSLEGREERMRLDDGIHFTPAGYALIAERVMQTLTAGNAAGI